MENPKKTTIDRRDFLKSAVGSATVLVAQGTTAQQSIIGNDRVQIQSDDNSSGGCRW